MRTNKSRKQIVFSVARFMLLVTCFVLVFAFALAQNATTVANVADAANHSGERIQKTNPTDGEASLGVATPINSTLTALDFGYPGSASSWTKTIDFSDIRATENNHQIYKNDGNTVLYTWVNDYGGIFNYGVTNGAAANSVFATINYRVSPFMEELLQRPDVKISAYFTMTIERNGNTKRGGYSAAVSEEGLSGKDCKTAKDDGGWGTQFEESTNETINPATSNTVYLTKENPVFSILSYVGWNLGVSKDRWITLSNIKITFTITMDNTLKTATSTNNTSDITIYDGSAPVVASEYMSDVTDTYAPYRTSTAQSQNWPMWFESLENALAGKVDSVTNGEGKLSSYTTGNKTSSITYVDTACYYSDTASFSYQSLLNIAQNEGAAAVATAAQYMYIGDKRISGVDVDNQSLTYTTGDLRYVSGIRTVTVGDRYRDVAETQNAAYFEMWSISIGSGSTKDIYVEGVKVGYATVKRTNRAQVVVNVTMEKNANVSTVVEDFGGQKLNKRIQYSGIDKTNPGIGEDGQTGATFSGISMTEDDYIKHQAGQSTLSWYRRETFKSDAEIAVYEEDNDYTPYVWFYSVAKSSSSFSAVNGTPKIYDSIDKLIEQGMVPIAYGDFTSFEYDFTTGCAKQYGYTSGDFLACNASELGAKTGVGYYRFTFYVFDMAGNYGGYETFFVQVDYSEPTFSLNLSYVDDATNANVEITKDNNGIWATGKTTLLASLARNNLSGYTFILEDEDENAYIFVLNASGQLVRYGKTGNIVEAEGNNVSLEIDSKLQSMTVNVIVTPKSGSTPARIKFVFDNADKTFAFNGRLTAYSGQYQRIDDPEDDVMKLDYFDNDWRLMHILIDRKAPNTPIVEGVEDGGCFVEGVKYEMPTTRDWYVNGYSFDTSLTFFDEVVDSDDYSSGIKIYVGMKNVVNQAQIDALAGLNIESVFATINSSNFTTYFDRLTTINGSSLSGNQTDVTLDIVKTMGAGMRMFYVWAVDQAGNHSELATYYMLVDGTVYTVRSSVLANPVLGNTASVEQVDGDDAATTSFMRGESVYVTVGTVDGFVPYTLTRISAGQPNVLLLANYSPQLAWTQSNEDYASIISVEYPTITYIHDDPTSLGTLSAITTLEFAHRRVISYTVTNRQVSYTSQALVLPMTLNVDSAREAFRYVYVDDDDNVLYAKVGGGSTTDVTEAVLVDGQPQLFVPVAVGQYNVKILIEKDHPSYITNDYAQDEDGHQVAEAIGVQIIKGNAVIKAVATSSEYGQPIVLEYTLEGIIEENLVSEGVLFTLELKIDGYNPTTAYDAGSYVIVATGLNNEDSHNYNVSFESAIHIINRKTIEVVTWSGSKAYGDADPTSFLFGVKASQFANVDELDIVFGSAYTKRGQDTYAGDLYYLFDTDSRVSRASGDSVGEYEYIPEASLFVVGSNYKVLIQNTQYFYITQREVTIDVSGQYVVLPYGSTVEPTVIIPTYAISTIDSAVSSDVATLLENKLSLSTSYTVGSNADYSATYLYTVLLDTAENDNIKVVLGEDVVYTVYIANAAAVLVNLKPGAVIALPYGTVWHNDSTIVYDNELFDVSADAPAFATISWSASISSGDNSIPNVGSYLVSVTNAKLLDGEGVEVPAQVLVSTFSITVTPQIITVVPTSIATSKVYGELDSVYGISFAISTVAGLGFAQGDEFAGLSYDALLATINGSFARARYTVDGSFRAYGSIYDDATNALGIILDTTLGSGEYYGYVVDAQFTSSNSNFTVQAVLDYDARFIVNPKRVDIDTKDFVGISKAYDGTTSVNYTGNVVAYDLSSSLIRSEDVLTLTYDAVYKSKYNDGSDIGNPVQSTLSSILFTNLSLGGASAYNYVLGNIVNGSSTAELNGSTANTSAIVNGETTVRIYYIDNNANANEITIYLGEIGVRKSDIIVSKQYDNTTRLTIDAIRIVAVQDGNINTTLLSQSIANGTAYVIADESDEYANVSVSNNYILSTLSIFFPIPNAGGILINDLGANSEVSVTYQVVDGVEGIKVSVVNMQAFITKRVLDANSFEVIEAVNRDYNATGYVDLTYVFAGDALADGETANMVDLTLRADITDGTFNAGTHSVKVADVSATQDGVSTYVGNSNYEIDVNSINNIWQSGLTVLIDRAKLMPNVLFETREYDGTSNVNAVAQPGLELTTLHYATNLQDELAHFSIDGTVSYMLSTDGVENPNVTENLLHNVMVSGLTIVESGDNNYLANYQIYGARFADENYNSVGSITSGALIADYEMIEAMELTRKTLRVIANNIEIKDKVYDGTVDAIITIKLPEDEVVPEHLDWLQIVADGKFARRQVGNNINVTVSNVRLETRTAEGNSIFYNYNLVPFKGKLTGNIVPRPVVMSADLGEKEYNGQAVISKSSIKYTFDGILENEQQYYAIQTSKNAYYINSDVEVERDPIDNHVIYRSHGEVLTYLNGYYVEYHGNVTTDTDPVYGNTIYLSTSNERVYNVEGVYYVKYEGEVTALANGRYETPTGESVIRQDGHYYTAAGEHAHEKEATVLPKQGTIFDPILANTKENYINYVLTQKLETKTTDNYIAYCDKEGKMHYYELASDDNDVEYYCYPLSTTTKYVAVNEPEAIAAAKADNAIVGFYGAKGNSGYLVREDWVAPEGISVYPLPRATTYFNAQGVITQRRAYIKADGIRKTDRATAFIKEYDATTKFFGVRADDAMGYGDYYYDENSISNVIDGDDVMLEDVVAEFEQSNTGSTYVRFTVSGIIGADSYKYATGTATASTRLHATITKRSIDASLADGQMTYGTIPSNAPGEITYSLAGYPLIWVESIGSFMMNFKEYLVALGFLNDVNGSIDPDDLPYLKSAIARTFDIIDGEWVHLAEEDIGEYVRLAGVFSLPRPTATFASSKPVVGDTAKTYTLTKGEATNYVFSPVYTNGASSTLEVIKKDLYIATAGISRSKNYGEADPAVVLNYYDASGSNKGIVSGESPTALFRIGGANIYPVAHLAIYNTITGVTTLVDKYAKVTADLADDEYYVYVLTAPDGVNYDELIHNYNIIFGTVTHQEVFDDFGDPVYENGKRVIRPVFEYEGMSFNAPTSQLAINLPTLTNVSVRSNNNTFVYERDVNRVGNVVMGLADGDIVKYVSYETGVEVEKYAINAGEYNGYIRVSRPVMIDSNDPNGYYITWTSSDMVAITIEKADINARAESVVTYYTGTTQTYEVSGPNNKFSFDYVTIPNSDKIITIEQLVNGNWVPATLLNAGEYRVTVTLSENFARNNPNYKSSPAVATYTILRAVVNVTFNDAELDISQDEINGARVIVLSGEFDPERNYDDVGYTISMDASVAPNARITVDQTAITYSKEVNQAGRYPFSVVVADPSKDIANYNVIGGVGVLDLSTTVVTSSNAVATIVDGITANRLIARVIDDENYLASDAAYLETIKSYMPTISTQADLDYEAKVACVIRFSLMCDDRNVSLDGKEVQMSVELPEKVKSMKNIAIYYVTQEGGLRKLSDYQIVDGKLEYTTDNLASLVFVDISPRTMEDWMLYTVIAIGAFFGVFVIWAIIAIILRKKNLKKLVD